MCSEDFKLKVDERFEQTRFYVRTSPCDAAAHQARQNSLAQIVPRKHVGDCQRKRSGRIAFVAAQPHDSRARLCQQILAGAIAPLAGLTIPADRPIYEPWVRL